MTDLQICLLGSFQVSWDFKPVPASQWGDPRTQRLLKLLLLRRPAPVPAAEAAMLLGGVDPDELIPRINRVLSPAAAVKQSPEGLIHFESTPSCWIDLDTMHEQYQTGVSAALRGEMLSAVLAFQEADALFQGDLLEEVQEPWVTEPRRRLRAVYTEILDRLAEGHAVLARYQDAVGFCHKALAHDPLREITYQRMMVYYYYLGDLQGAREAYEECGRVLADTGRHPSLETQALWQRLSRSERADQLPAALAAPGLEGTLAGAAGDEPAT